MVEPWNIAAFYKFASLPGFRELQVPVLSRLRDLEACGSILLAEEGINGTIACQGPIAVAIAEIEGLTGIKGIEAKFSVASEKPFRRMKVRLKKEIVTIGPVEANPTAMVGQYVQPKDWNSLIAQPDIVLVDTRNSYEFGVGSFEGAVDPKTESFSEFPAWARNHLKDKKQKIAMFCTGGIRCEKASSFLKHQGYENVFHLKGGILKYLEEVPQDQSLWRGGCFVFDERVAVGHGLQVLDFSICHGCLAPVGAEDRKNPKFEAGVCCPACADGLTEVQKASNRERQKQVELAAARGRKHLGPA